jgi:hypothetical protein
MTLILDLSDQDETRLVELARSQGLDPAEAAMRLIHDHLPTNPKGENVPDAENSRAISLPRSWLAEEATADPQAIRDAQEEMEEFKRSMNANREATGERLVCP